MLRGFPALLLLHAAFLSPTLLMAQDEPEDSLLTGRGEGAVYDAAIHEDPIDPVFEFTPSTGITETDWRDGRQRFQSDPQARLLISEQRLSSAPTPTITPGSDGRLQLQSPKVYTPSPTSSYGFQQKPFPSPDEIQSANPAAAQQELLSREEALLSDEALPPTLAQEIGVLTGEIDSALSTDSFVEVDGEDFSTFLTDELGEDLVPTDAGGRLYAPGLLFFGWDVQPSFSLKNTYNDNIYLAAKNSLIRSDVITTFSPKVLVKKGNPRKRGYDTSFASLQYSPRFKVFTDQDRENAFVQSVNLQGGTRFTKLSLLGKMSFIQNIGAEEQLGELINRTILTTNGSVQYALSPLTSLESNATYTTRLYDVGFDSDTYTLRGWVNYAIHPKVRLGIGPGASYRITEGSPDQQTYSGNVRAVWTPSVKTTFFLTLGGSELTVNRSNYSRTSLSMSGGGKWEVDPITFLSFNLNRHEQASNAFRNQNLETTGFSSAISRRITKKLAGSFGLGASTVEYFGTTANAQAGREDYFVSIAPSVTYQVKSWWSMSFSYQYRYNFSNIAKSEYENNVVSLGSSIRF